MPLPQKKSHFIPFHYLELIIAWAEDFYKSVQILAYADDIDISGRTQAAMIEAFTGLEKAAKGMNLFINPEKTKYMPVIKNSHASYPHYLEVGPYKF